MSFIIGKLARRVSKQHNEYFVGRICGLPVRGSWSKKSQDDLCVFLDNDKINFLSKEGKGSALGQAAQGDRKE